MALVEIYMRPMCGFCAAAKRLLDGKGVSYTEYNIWEEDGRQAEMIQRSNGGRTVPQIFINDQHIGGCDDMMAMEKSGKLDPLLG
ncbi:MULTISPECIES: glutaredoxin 3 [Curvivirga]|uniref:glutaredoxin 3 n=1 Tax=Curvivirga TaxID=2856846 RepID=UPI0012BBA080|nr:glutaredoxin 3 [Curvivirga aplysinae]MTI08660.1 glutaredoxin 3 [Curvivirga aplysinae]